jgi:hypothetical protein
VHDPSLSAPETEMGDMAYKDPSNGVDTTGSCTCLSQVPGIVHLYLLMTLVLVSMHD